MPGQRIELPPFSMMASTPIYEVNGETVFGLMLDAITPDASDDTYPVPPGGDGRWDLISAEVYGTPELFWVLPLVNRTYDAIIGPAVGDIIRVPTKERLDSKGLLNV